MSALMWHLLSGYQRLCSARRVGISIYVAHAMRVSALMWRTLSGRQCLCGTRRVGDSFDIAMARAVQCGSANMALCIVHLSSAPANRLPIRSAGQSLQCGRPGLKLGKSDSCPPKSWRGKPDSRLSCQSIWQPVICRRPEPENVAPRCTDARACGRFSAHRLPLGSSNLAAPRLTGMPCIGRYPPSIQPHTRSMKSAHMSP